METIQAEVGCGKSVIEHFGEIEEKVTQLRSDFITAYGYDPVATEDESDPDFIPGYDDGEAEPSNDEPSDFE